MAKTKCINCGETMQPHYSRDGAVIFVCPNVKITIKREHGLTFGYMFCDIAPTNAHSNSTLSPLLVDSKECVKLYAKSLTLKESFKEFAKTITLNQLRSATQHTISDVKLLESANLALVLGLEETQLPALFEAGMKLGYAVGLTSEKAIESLAKGIARKSRLILDNIGITFTTEQAYSWYKTERGADKQHLNDTEKTDAWRQYAIHKVIELGDKLDVNKERLAVDQKHANIVNLKTTYGQGLQ